jgi:hypothetical protein
VTYMIASCGIGMTSAIRTVFSNASSDLDQFSHHAVTHCQIQVLMEMERRHGESDSESEGPPAKKSKVKGSFAAQYQQCVNATTPKGISLTNMEYRLESRGELAEFQ